MRWGDTQLVFTCEHGGNRVPRGCESLFAGDARLLASHRGWDIGALAVARALARAMNAPLIAATLTRLLVDLNRSASNPRVFSEATRALSRADRSALLARYHQPHRARVTEAIDSNVGTTVHIAVHSFTPTLDGQARNFDAAVLYDPKRVHEKRFARQWQGLLEQGKPLRRVRRNAPYRGDSDGLTTALRKGRPPTRYLGIELELNQARLVDPRERRAIVLQLAESLRAMRSAPSPGRSH